VKKVILIEKTIIYIILTLVSALFLFPIVYVVLTSLKEPVDAFSIPPKWLFIPTLKYHLYIWTEKPFFRYLINSLVIAGGTAAISVPIASFAAYGFVRHKGKETFIILLGLLAIRMFPQMLLVIPYFLIARTMHLHDTRIVMILIMVAFNQPFSIWLMRGFFMNVPKEIDEAAIVDGCTHLGAVCRVILPVVLPGIATTAIFSFLLAYNDYLFALILTGANAKTLPVAIAGYVSEDVKYWSIGAAGATGIIVPIIMIMIFLQKYFVKGLMSGAIK